MPGPEVVELPALGEVLGAALLFVAWAVCLGVLWAYRRSLKLVILKFADLIDISVLHQHPLGHVANWLRTEATNIDHLLAAGVTASERGAVVLFKLFLNTQLWIARETADLATDTWHAIRGAQHATITKVTNVVTHTVVKPITTTVTIVKGTSATIAKQITAQAHALNARVTRLEHALGHAVASPFPRIGHIERDIANQGKRLAHIEKKTVGLGAVALVTAALARMGFKWIKCDAAKSVGRRLNCGSFRFLESLLSLAIDALVITNLCATTKLLTRLAYDVLPLVSALTHGVEKLMECQGATRAPDVKLNAATLPALDKSLIKI